jgi:hypothetical protein
MNVELGAEAALFPEKEYINGIAVAVQRCNGTNAGPGCLEVSMGWPCISLPWGGWQCSHCKIKLGGMAQFLC